MAVEIIQIDPQTLTSQTYETQDTSLIPTFELPTSFSSGSKIEFIAYDLNQNLLYSDLSFTDYKVLNDGQSSGNGTLSQIEIDPEKSLTEVGFNQGSYIAYYNFLNNKIGSEIEPLYITEISSDRTEIRLDSIVLDNQSIIDQTNAFIQERSESDYFVDFYLNFGDNFLFISNNIVLDNEDPSNPTVLIKLYEPLPLSFDINSILWVVSSIEEPIAYQVNFIEEPIVFDDTVKIKGPNFNIELKDQVNNSTLELSYSDLLNTSLTSSQNQLNSFLEEKEIDINIDYTSFPDFIHFSSAKTRLENFYYKVNLIEQYSSSIALIESEITGSTSSSLAVNDSKTVLQNKIDEIITNFDGWDYYLYYTSGSYAWPKTTTEPPYLLASTGSAAVLSWFGSTNEYSPNYGGLILSASLFDNSNKDNLLFSIPEYLRDDSENAPYELFIDMVAQHFDNIWIYYKDVTQKYNNDNRLEYGISKDIVADAIRDFGVKLYQNNFSNQDLYTAFLGLTPEGALFPFPEITGSLPTPSGFEYVNTLISASNDYIPLDDVNKSLYKRIYHNLPYLLKAKGTIPGLRALITSYGIPDTILRINEYGGKDKVNSNDWDYWQNEFNYAFYTEGNNFITSSWSINANWDDSRPSTVLFRFKTNGLPETNIPYSQSLWNKGDRVHVVLTYTGSGYVSGSYSGSIKDPYYQYATLTLYPAYNTNPTVSSSIYLPFFDGGWWSVMAEKSGSTYSIYSGNKIYEGGENGTLLGFYASSSVNVVSNDWRNTTGGSIFASSSVINGNIYNSFSGSLQEIRYYQYAFGNSLYEEDEFKDYIMNPYSIEGHSLNSSPNELVFRASLGGELYTGSTSIHPKVTGSWPITQSFASDSNFYFDQPPVFISNTEYFFYDQPIAGIKNTISDKIRIEGNTLPTGSTLSPFRRLEQVIEASSSYTPNINYLEVAFSPQNEINEDIMDQLGFFNIGDYIGNPLYRSSRLTSYTELDNLRNDYFEKYTKNYNLVDFIRLIKFFDNSLFKMIRDFVPARTSLASGIVIKQHLLERNRYPQPQIEWEDVTYTGSIEIGEFNGGTGGVFEIFNGINTSPYGINGNGPDNIFGITQSWDETYTTPLGNVTVLHDSQEEFYDGEFNGSNVIVTTQILNEAYPLDFQSFEYTPILYRNGLYGVNNISTLTEGQFLNYLTTPNSGEMLILAPRLKKTTLERQKAYLKIHKFDCNGNDNTIPLGQITKLLIKYTTGASYIEYDILNISEYSNYYLYEISNQNIDNLGTGIDTEIKDYYVSSSKVSTLTITSTSTTINNWSSSSGNVPHYGTPYFNTSSGVYTLENTPNIPLILTASIYVFSNAGSPISGKFDILLNSTAYQSNPISITPGYSTHVISSSLFLLESNQLSLQISRTGPVGATVYIESASLCVTQSISPTASVCDPIILEPYITTPNFYNSDENALLNSVNDNRLSTIWQDVDYSTGALVPTNFSLLISGSATKAAIQDSNYTLARHTNPRYDGSRTTSQKLNTWSNGDTGTYGKLPTIESTKTYVAYSNNMGGYPPEKMNSSGIIIKYFISEDGDLIAPNTDPNALYINQGSFQSGENIYIESLGDSTNTQPDFKTIIRGGSKIEPILTNQISHYQATTMSFASEINFTDGNSEGTVTIGDYGATLSPAANINPTPLIWTNVNMASVLSEGNDITDELNNISRYTITGSGLPSEVSNLVFDVNVKLQNANQFPFDSTGYVRLVRERSSVITPIEQGYANGSGIIPPSSTTNVVFSSTIPRNEIEAGDQFYLQVLVAHSYVRYTTASTFKISQIPLPTTPISCTGLWNYSIAAFPNRIFASSSLLLQYYENPQTHQQDIANSGFFPITLPFTIQPGDEFRFEGDEVKTFIVKSATIVSESLPRPRLSIEFSTPISGSGINLNQFLIRRYVDTPASIIFNGYKTSGLDGPYLIKPEYISEKMEQNIGKYIEDFTQKGLL